MKLNHQSCICNKLYIIVDSKYIYIYIKLHVHESIHKYIIMCELGLLMNQSLKGELELDLFAK